MKIQEEIAQSSQGHAVTTSQGEPRTLNVDQAAAYSGFGRQAIRDSIAAGQLKAIRIGRNIRVAVAELERFIRAATDDGLDLADFRSARRSSWPSEYLTSRSRTRRSG